MSKRILLLVGAVVAVILVIAAVVIGNRNANRSSNTTPTVQVEPALLQAFGTATATQTLIPAVTETPAVNGFTCTGDCVWSTACVTLGMTMPEQGNMTRVHANSCVPIDPNYWNITPDNPFWGMPCSRDTIGTCVWSRECVDLGRLVAVKNGLAPAVVGSCQAAP